jgi:hypothetical protein
MFKEKISGLLRNRNWQKMDLKFWKCVFSTRTGCWWGSLRERDHWGDPDVDGRIILEGIFRKWEGIVGTGWSGLRIETGGGHL